MSWETDGGVYRPRAQRSGARFRVQADLLRRIAGMLDDWAELPELAAVAIDDSDQVVRLQLRMEGGPALAAMVAFAGELGVEVEPVERGVTPDGWPVVDHQIVLFRPDGLTVVVEAAADPAAAPEPGRTGR